MVAKLLLVSVLMASIIVPFLSAHRDHAELALRTVLVRSVLFLVTYGLLLRFVYARVV